MKMPWIKALSIIGLITSILVGIKAYQIKQTTDAEESFSEHSETVESAWLIPSKYSRSIRVIGKILSPEQLQVVSELEGRIVEVGFSLGSPVKKDQLLIRQDSSEEDALLKAAESRLQLAKTILLRNQRLLKSKAVSQEDVDRALVSFDNTEAEIAQLISIIRKKHIHSPFAATTGMQQHHKGQILSANEFITELVGETQERWIDIYLPQSIMPLSVNSSVDFFLDHISKPFKAQIIASSSSLNLNNKNRHYRAKFNINQDSRLTSLAIGSSVKVEIVQKNMPNTKKVWQVPSTSILYSLQGSYVFLLVPDMEYEKDNNKKINDESKPNGLNKFRAIEKYVEVLNKTVEKAKIKFIEDEPHSMLVAANGAFKLYSEVLTITTPPMNSKIK